MKAKELYNHLEIDFPVAICVDDWSGIGNQEYITQQYKNRYMGLLADNSEFIDCVYTAVFPSNEVVNKIINDNRRNALLFLHHPLAWDITKVPIFTDVPVETMELFKQRNISIFNYHAPLDANGEYSTTTNFARALDIKITDGFYEYHNVLVGIVGETECTTVSELQCKFEKAVGHSIKLYQYGDKEIKDNKVALIAGGGNEADVYPMLKTRGINTYLTGIASLRAYFQPSVDAHNSARDCKVNIMSGTHYSTEKFACIKMVEYFKRFDIESEFIVDKPCMEDM